MKGLHYFRTGRVCAFADDLTGPRVATTFAHLDATTVLSRSISSLGIYPLWDPLSPTPAS